MRLVLVRHAESTSNVVGVIDSQIPGPSLTARGMDQARSLVSNFAGWHIDAIYASTQVRSQMTAQPLAADRGIDVTIADGTREITAGAFELQGDDLSIAAYLEVAYSWITSCPQRRMPGGESGTEFITRFDAVVEEVSSAHETAVLFGHGMAIRTWAAARARNVEPVFAAARDLDNTESIVLEGDSSQGWEVLKWRDEILSGYPIGEQSPL